MNELLTRVWYHNSLQDYLIAGGIIMAGLLLVQLVKKLILTRIKNWAARTQNGLDDYILKAVDRFGVPALYYATIYAGISFLTLSKKATHVLDVATTAVITFLILRLLSATIQVLLRSYVQKHERGEEKVKQLGGLMLIVNIFIWILGLLFLFDNMGYNVTTIITGLGIGGIAVALAAQNILGDLFNYFVIFFDRPFEVGDFIIIDNKMGVVDYIGLKTTRLKSLTGEQLIVANSDLTNSRIHNHKRMTRRRVLFTITVTYQTPYEKLKTIPALLRSIVEEQEPVLFDRAHFASYGESSLNYEVVYYVLDSNYGKYMDIQQAINFRIYEEFEKMGVDFAYPTQTLFVQPNWKREGEQSDTLLPPTRGREMVSAQ